MGKRKRETKSNPQPKDDKEQLPAVRISDEPVKKKAKWTNKERVLVFSSRGIAFRDRHLMNDLRTLMPHSKSDSKMDRKDRLFVINELCEMKNCKKCIFFEKRKKKDLYMWLSNVPSGPSVKFLVENVHTMSELKMTGNCLKGTRPLLSFDRKFETEPEYAILKELMIQIFSTPNYHPKSQPFIDHVMTFSVADNRIWFRNYQILEENGELAEIGPRMVLNPIRIFQGSFGGPTLFQNPEYVSPNELRRAIKLNRGRKYADRVSAKESLAARRSTETYRSDPTDAVFDTRKN